MALKTIGTYEFPSRSRQELYGEDMLVHVWWKDNPMFCAAATFRAPQAMSWGDFRAAIVDPWASSDPDYDAAHEFSWGLDGQPFTQVRTVPIGSNFPSGRRGQTPKPAVVVIRPRRS